MPFSSPPSSSFCVCETPLSLAKRKRERERESRGAPFPFFSPPHLLRMMPSFSPLPLVPVPHCREAVFLPLPPSLLYYTHTFFFSLLFFLRHYSLSQLSHSSSHTDTPAPGESSPPFLHWRAFERARERGEICLAVRGLRMEVLPLKLEKEENGKRREETGLRRWAGIP